MKKSFINSEPGGRYNNTCIGLFDFAVTNAFYFFVYLVLNKFLIRVALP